MLRRFWRQKKSPKIPKERLTVKTDECITLELPNGNQISFSLGVDENGTWYALTDPHIIPKFCFQAESKDEAYIKGVDAINYYIENVLA